MQRPPGGARGHGMEGADLFVELVAQMFRPTERSLTICEEANTFGHFFCRCFSVCFLYTHLKSREYFSLHSSTSARDRRSDPEPFDTYEPGIEISLIQAKWN